MLSILSQTSNSELAAYDPVLPQIGRGLPRIPGDLQAHTAI